MTGRATWDERNALHLGVSLAWLRARLEALARGEPAGGTAACDALARELAEVESVEPPPALSLLAQRFGLTRFERDVLLLCVAMALDTRIASLCAAAQGDATRPWPTFALALALFDDATWDALSPDRPLRRWRLIELRREGAQVSTMAALCADERIVNFSKGLNHLDESLAALLVPLNDEAGHAPLPPSQQATVDEVLVQWMQSDEDGCATVQLLGMDTPSKLLVSRHAAARLECRVLRLSADLLPTAQADLDALARLWRRETLLLPWVLYVDRLDDAAAPAARAVLDRFLARTGGLVLIDTRDALPHRGGRLLPAVDCARPTPAEQRAAWRDGIGAHGGAVADALSAQFDLDDARIRRIATTVSRSEAQGAVAGVSDVSSLRDALWQACKAAVRPALDASAQRIDARATWDDLVLPEAQVGLLRQICAQVRCRHRVQEDWGFRRRMNRGLGISALFEGSSGVGKTMAAEVIANDLSLALYRIDLSSVMSKYIGETEENLRRLFDAAEDGGAILFFDECDALFGKRSEVRDSHDRFANVQTNYLLQRVEAFRGLAILATNMRSALDGAFLRRLRFIVTFPFPEPAQRQEIWRKAFPPELPKEALDYERLGRINLAGGSIHSAALCAAFLAADAGTRLGMRHVLAAIRSEFVKLGRPVNEADFRVGKGQGVSA